MLGPEDDHFDWNRLPKRKLKIKSCVGRYWIHIFYCNDIPAAQLWVPRKRRRGSEKIKAWKEKKVRCKSGLLLNDCSPDPFNFFIINRQMTRLLLEDGQVCWHWSLPTVTYCLSFTWRDWEGPRSHWRQHYTKVTFICWSYSCSDISCLV